MGFSFFPVFSCSASGFMRQLNKAVNAWGSLRPYCVCVCACTCAGTSVHMCTRMLSCFTSTRDLKAEGKAWFHTRADFPKELSKNKANEQKRMTNT